MARASLCFLLLAVSALALGGEVAEAPVADESWVLPAWLNFVLSFDFIWQALVTVGGILFAWLGKILVTKAGEDQAKKDAVLALEAAVTATYEQFVRQCKADSKDGKLTVEERQAARNMAIDKAKELAKGPALKMLQAWGKPLLDSLVQKIVGKLKEKKE